MKNMPVLSRCEKVAESNNLAKQNSFPSHALGFSTEEV